VWILFAPSPPGPVQKLPVTSGVAGGVKESRERHERLEVERDRLGVSLVGSKLAAVVSDRGAASPTSVGVTLIRANSWAMPPA
jgi:hypothetical protein